VYAKPPFGGPDCVLKYLARYTHRIAISNHRILSVSQDQVSFTWKDYKHGHRRRVMTLDRTTAQNSHAASSYTSCRTA
jgi:hypothetical protein